MSDHAPSADPRRRLKEPKTRRNIILAAALLLLAALTLWWALSRSAGVPLHRLTGGLLIGVLSLANTLLITALLAIILREGIKLLFERQAGRGRFKARLLFAFLGLSLAPAVLLPLAAYALVQQSISRWFSASSGAVSEQGRQLLEQSYRHFREHAARQTGVAIGDFAGAWPEPAGRPRKPRPLPADCAARMRGLRPATDYGLDDFSVTFADGLTCRAPGGADAPDPGELRTIPEGSERVIDAPGGGQWVAARRAFTLPAAWGGQTVAVYGVVRMDGALAARARAMEAEFQSWREEQSRKRGLKALVLGYFLIITLTVVLFVVWIAPQVARAVTRPIDRLAEATAQLTAGNLAVDIPAEGRGEDELGLLTAGFNRMAAQLRAEAENREVQARALRAARESAERQTELLEGLLSHLEAGVLLFDREGSLARFNPAAAEILGLPLAPLLGKDPRRVTDGAEPWAALLSVPAARGAVRVEVPRGGELRHLEVRVTPLDEGQSLLLVEDVTDLVRAERLGAWQEVAQKMAHEIKNPLTPIQLAAERLLARGEEAPAPLAKVIGEATGAIREEVVALKRLVDEFSRFARLPAVELREEDVVPLLRSVAGLYESGAPKIETLLTEGRIAVRHDPAALRGILINLLDNARAAAGASGRIWLSLGTRGRQALIEVADNGPGIPTAMRGRIFSPFFTTKRGGTGLGLAIAARAAREMGGALQVDERPGGGARFTVSLPLA